MIIPSKQLLLLTPSDHKQIMLFDPKTGCVLQTYRSQNQIASIAAYYEQGQQFIIPNLNNSFVFVWDTDTQQPRKFTVGDGEKISYVRVGVGNVAYVGSENGMLYIYQLPAGILIKKVQLHAQHSKSSQIKTIILQHPLGSIITSTKNQLKQFTLHNILSSTNQKPLPLHTIQSVLQIKSIEVVRNILCVITERTIQLYYASNFMPFHLGKDLPQVQGITCSCASSGSVFVGDGDGKVREIVVEGGEMGLRYEERKGRLLVESKKGIQIQCKQPITSLKYIESLSYLMLTTSKGNIQIHNTSTQTHKNTLQLSKSPLQILLVLPRPNKQIKIPQSHKIRSFHKQQLNKLDQPILYNSGDNHQLVGLYQLMDQKYNDEHSLGKNDVVLEKMFGLLCDQSQSVREEVQAVRKDNLGLVEANLRYFGILEAIGDECKEKN